MPDRGDDGAGAVGGAGRAQRPTGSPCATPRSRPHRDGVSPPCFLSDISGWSLSLVGAPPPAGRRRRFRFSECRIGATMAPARSAAPGELSDLPGRRAQHPDRDRTGMECLRRAFSLTFLAGLYPLSGRRRLLAAVADSVLANAGSGRRWRRRGRRRRASSATYRVAVRNTPIATAPGWSVSAVLSL